MEKQLEQISEQQKQSWNKFSSGWEKWDSLTMDFLQPMGDEITRKLDLTGNETVLDIASGTGEPAISIAKILTGGKVVATDLAEGMLEVARKKAADLNLKNIEIMVADVSNLPFDDNSFDAISCRFGFMFFPDMLMSAREMFRVLKPDGKIATSVWNVAEKNFWVTAIMGTIKAHMEVAPIPPGAPSMFRCAGDSLMTSVFAQAGFKNISVDEVKSIMRCETPEQYWNFMTDVGAPIVAALSKADEKTIEKIKTEVLQKVKHTYGEQDVAIKTSALVVYGEK